MSMNARIGQTTFNVGDTVQVHYKIIEKEKIAGKTKRSVKEEKKERIQIFEGIIIGIRGKSDEENFIVRRIGTANIGVERIFPVNSPWIKKIVVKKQGSVRRAKLYYLRKYKGKDAIKIKEKKSIVKVTKSKKSKKVKTTKKKAIKTSVKETKKSSNEKRDQSLSKKLSKTTKK